MQKPLTLGAQGVIESIDPKEIEAILFQTIDIFVGIANRGDSDGNFKAMIQFGDAIISETEPFFLPSNTSAGIQFQAQMLPFNKYTWYFIIANKIGDEWIEQDRDSITFKLSLMTYAIGAGIVIGVGWLLYNIFKQR